MATRFLFFFFFKQKTAYEMRISDWSSDVCSSDLPLVDIAAPYAHLLELSVTPHAQRRGDIGLATGAIAVEFDDHVRDLVRVHQRVAMLRADVVDHAAATTLIDIGAVVGNAVVVPDRMAERNVEAIDRAAIERKSKRLNSSH